MCALRRYRAPVGAKLCDVVCFPAVLASLNSPSQHRDSDSGDVAAASSAETEPLLARSEQRTVAGVAFTSRGPDETHVSVDGKLRWCEGDKKAVAVAWVAHH